LNDIDPMRAQAATCALSADYVQSLGVVRSHGRRGACGYERVLDRAADHCGQRVLSQQAGRASPAAYQRQYYLVKPVPTGAGMHRRPRFPEACISRGYRLAC
jgi:hypothetical protein